MSRGNSRWQWWLWCWRQWVNGVCGKHGGVDERRRARHTPKFLGERNPSLHFLSLSVPLYFSSHPYPPPLPPRWLYSCWSWLMKWGALLQLLLCSAAWCSARLFGGDVHSGHQSSCPGCPVSNDNVMVSTLATHALFAVQWLRCISKIVS